MFSFNITHNQTYGEVPQANPLRWRIMLREKRVLHSQSSLIKCKDFFNDVVAWKNAQKEFKIYSFDNKVKFNRAGLYLLLTGISSVRKFKKNIEVLNQRIQQDLGTKLSIYSVKRGSVVLHIPNGLWTSTYRISLVTMLIRVCNYDVLFTDWDSFFAPESPLNTIEVAFKAEAKGLTQQQGFKEPKKAAGCWYFASHGYTSASDKDILPSVVHNNGAQSWAIALKTT